MSCQCEGWSAVAHRDEGVRMLTVTATCTCNSGGHRLELEPSNPGINPQPDEVVLALRVEEPTGPSTTDMPQVPLSYSTAIGDEDRVVLIHVPDGNGERIEIRDE